MDLLGTIFKAKNAPNWMVVGARELVVLSKHDAIKAANELEFFYQAARERILATLYEQPELWDQR